MVLHNSMICCLIYLDLYISYLTILSNKCDDTNSNVSDGKEQSAKQLIQSVDEEKKLIQLKTLEGDLLELYKTFVVTIHVETNDDIDLVTWTLEYEMRNEDVEHPISLLSYFIDITKDIETHHLAKP